MSKVIFSPVIFGGRSTISGNELKLDFNEYSNQSNFCDRVNEAQSFMYNGHLVYDSNSIETPRGLSYSNTIPQTIRTYNGHSITNDNFSSKSDGLDTYSELTEDISNIAPFTLHHDSYHRENLSPRNGNNNCMVFNGHTIADSHVLSSPHSLKRNASFDIESHHGYPSHLPPHSPSPHSSSYNNITSPISMSMSMATQYASPTHHSNQSHSIFSANMLSNHHMSISDHKNVKTKVTQ
jgi:hypothetical protein